MEKQRNRIGNYVSTLLNAKVEGSNSFIVFGENNKDDEGTNASKCSNYQSESCKLNFYKCHNFGVCGVSQNGNECSNGGTTNWDVSGCKP
ncbi:MAG: hypothetical protein NC217_05680 [Muribaculaceae bacterium]|nr:hypothetical protein [Muribaculaceae bacterium]